MATPGSFPEPSAPRRSPLRLVVTLFLATGAIVFVGMIAWVAVLCVRLKDERDRTRAEADRLMGLLQRRPRPEAPASLPPPAGDLERRLADLEARLALLEADPPAPPRAPDLRVVPPAPLKTPDPRLFPQAPGTDARLRQLESRSYACLLVSSLAQGDYGMANAFLARALLADPAWFRRTHPREFLGEAALRRCIQTLEARVRADPMDAASKVLLAYLYFHEKGADHARALLVEAATVSPDNAEAKAFLEQLDK